MITVGSSVCVPLYVMAIRKRVYFSFSLRGRYGDPVTLYYLVFTFLPFIPLWDYLRG